MGSLDRPDNDHDATGELVEVIEELLSYSRACTLDEDEGEYEVVQRARALLQRYKPAT